MRHYFILESNFFIQKKTQLINVNKNPCEGDIPNIIKFNKHTIPTVLQQIIKYLGVTLDKRFTFRKHIDNTFRKGNDILTYLYLLLNTH